jgi:hypothetical protein
MKKEDKIAIVKTLLIFTVLIFALVGTLSAYYDKKYEDYYLTKLDEVEKPTITEVTEFTKWDEYTLDNPVRLSSLDESNKDKLSNQEELNNSELEIFQDTMINNENINDNTTNSNDSVVLLETDQMVLIKENGDSSEYYDESPVEVIYENKDKVLINEKEFDINQEIKAEEIKSVQPDRTKQVDKDIKVRALYLSGWTVGVNSRLNDFINLANETAINSYVVDIKDEDGLVAYKTELEEVKKIDAYKQKYKVSKVIDEFHKNDIYVIGRISCFKDPILSVKVPSWAIKKNDGSLWKDNSGNSWINPYAKESWEYIANLAIEATKYGFDEIQLDHITFPNTGRISAMDLSAYSRSKVEIINEFLAFMSYKLSDTKVSANIYGIVCESKGDLNNIGQDLETIGMNLDYISPMIYPSHFTNGQVINNVKILKPDLEPYKVVFNTLVKAKTRISKVENYMAEVRPYLQGFTASWLGSGFYQVYKTKEIKAQIQGVYDAGFDQWIIWNPSNRYDKNHFID